MLRFLHLSVWHFIIPFVENSLSHSIYIFWTLVLPLLQGDILAHLDPVFGSLRLFGLVYKLLLLTNVFLLSLSCLLLFTVEKLSKGLSCLLFTTLLRFVFLVLKIGKIKKYGLLLKFLLDHLLFLSDGTGHFIVLKCSRFFSELVSLRPLILMPIGVISIVWCTIIYELILLWLAEKSNSSSSLWCRCWGV